VIATLLQPFYGPLDFFWDYQVSRHQKGKTKTNLDFLEQQTVSGNGISWTICKSAAPSREINTPAPHHSVFYRLDALLTEQRTAIKEPWKEYMEKLMNEENE